MSDNAYVPSILFIEDTVVSDIEPLKDGGHSKVLKGRVNMVGTVSRMVAIKRMSTDFYAEAENELFFQKSKLIHPNIGEILRSTTDDDYVNIVMPLYSIGLDKILYNNFSINQPIQIMNQLVDALGFLHKNNFVHRDIKPENIMFDECNNIRLIDFSLSGRILDNTIEDFLPHALWYRAPEYHFGTKNDPKKGDIWALGMVLVELDTRRPVLAHVKDIVQYFATLIFPGNIRKMDNTNHYVYNKLTNTRTLPTERMNMFLHINPDLRIL